MKSKVEVGQIIYVTSQGMFAESKPNLAPYKVTKVNGSSFYAYNLNSEPSRATEERFNHKTMTHDTGTGFIHRAFLKEEDYWSLVKKEKERSELYYKISKKLSSLSLETLKEIEKVIESK